MTVENRMHDAILTTMDKVVIPRVEMAVRSITGSSGHGLNGIVQNPDWGEFTGSTENTPLMSASSRLDVNIHQNRIDETRDIEYFEDGDFPALRPNYDRRAHTHHIFTSRKKLLYTKKTTLKRSVNGGILHRKSGVHRYFSTPPPFWYKLPGTFLFVCPSVQFSRRDISDRRWTSAAIQYVTNHR